MLAYVEVMINFHCFISTPIQTSLLELSNQHQTILHITNTISPISFLYSENCSLFVKLEPVRGLAAGEGHN